MPVNFCATTVNGSSTPSGATSTHSWLPISLAAGR
jgi:hypothetical protein